MNLVSQYVIKVGAYVLLAQLLEGVLPQGSSKKIVKLMLSVLFLYVLAGPVILWVQEEIPLEELTTTDFTWEEADRQNTEYKKQADFMVEKGWVTALQQNLPKDLADEYQIDEVRIEEQEGTIQVSLRRNNKVGSFTDKSLNLGQIGVNREEEERVKKTLCEHWGIEPENLELWLR